MLLRSALGLVVAFGLAACMSELEANRMKGSFDPDAEEEPAPDAARSDRGASGSSSSSSGSSGASSSSSGGSGSSGSSGTGGGVGSNGASKPNCRFEAHATGLRQFQQPGGVSFHTYTSPSYDPEVGHRVVFLMHSQDSDGTAELHALWQSLADEQQLVLVAPKGSNPATDPGRYPNGANYAATDTPKIADLVPLIDDCFNVDPRRHLLWGFSAGTFYGYLLGIGAAQRFSGLAMGGANASFATQRGYPPAAASWAIPVSHVHGALDPNPISLTYADRDAFVAAGHTFTLHEHPGGHTITAEQVRMQWNDLKDSQSP